MKHQESDTTHCAALHHYIAERIRANPQQRVTFADFMDWVLYEPKLGYYAAQRQKIGAGGDFVTSPHLGADFGELLVGLFINLWQLLDCPHPFHLVEMGAGQGLIAGDILRFCRDRATQSPNSLEAEFWAALQYRIVERANILVAEQRSHLQPYADIEQKLQWTQWDAIADHSLTGCCFSNELVDAFPVHRVVKQHGKLQEIFVVNGPEPDIFSEQVENLSTPAIADYLQQCQVDLTTDAYPEGYRSEVNLGTADWLTTIAQKLQRGYLLTIDYGYTAALYYSPQRSQGTLQCYYRHGHHADPYWNVGRQDLTTHANFTVLEQQGAAVGLTKIGFTQQGPLLMALGLGDRLQANLENSSITDALQRRDALQGLINPAGLGGFGVLLQGKHCPTTEPHGFQFNRSFPW